ncbi:MAG TPA: hypothetical protein VE011_03040 [Candidatus Dormibacteraeota bacterium]|nr:hypothetical protein [Candidatus Dormibacteraeota bacterium]
MARNAVKPAVPKEIRALAGEGRAHLAEVRAAAAGCRACDLWARATQTVLGTARLVADLRSGAPAA